MNKQELAENLRKLADFVESKVFNTESAYFSDPELYLFCSDANSFLDNVKRVGGFKRNFNEYSAQAIKNFGDIKFIIHTSRETVCEKIKVGVQVLPATEDTIIPGKPERVVDKFEYKCPESLLKGVEEEVSV